MVEYYLVDELYDEKNANWKSIYLYDRFESENYELFDKYYYNTYLSWLPKDILKIIETNIPIDIHLNDMIIIYYTHYRFFRVFSKADESYFKNMEFNAYTRIIDSNGKLYYLPNKYITTIRHHNVYRYKGYIRYKNLKRAIEQTYDYLIKMINYK